MMWPIDRSNPDYKELVERGKDAVVQVKSSAAEAFLHAHSIMDATGMRMQEGPSRC